MVSRRSKLTVLCCIMSCMYDLSMGDNIFLSYLILSYRTVIAVIKHGGSRKGHTHLHVVNVEVHHKHRMFLAHDLLEGAFSNTLLEMACEVFVWAREQQHAQQHGIIQYGCHSQRNTYNVRCSTSKLQFPVDYKLTLLFQLTYRHAAVFL